MKRKIPNLVTHEIYDVLTGRTIQFYDGLLMQKCQELNIHYTEISHLKSGKHSSIASRYILPKNRDKLFVLVDYETEKEYECCCNGSIFLHLNIPYTKAEGKYIYELKRKRQIIASVNKHILYLKGNRDKITFDNVSKVPHPDVLERRKKSKLFKKIKTNLSIRMRGALLDQLLKKKELALDLLGCSTKEFIAHLENQFDENMNWNNYGRKEGNWSIDHIVPCSAFDLFTTEGQKIAFHYMNCQPMRHTLNIAKNNHVSNDVIEFIKFYPFYLNYITSSYKIKINNFLNQSNSNYCKLAKDSPNLGDF